jgi:hypothetical protein
MRLKKISLWMLTLMLILSMVPVQFAYASTKTIPDAALERAIKKELGITDPVTPFDLLFLTKLTVTGQNVRSLSGLQLATNLTTLNVSNNLIRDISPLAGLRNLTQLDVSGNQIRALCPTVGRLTTLTTLNASDNLIDNLSCFDKLPKIQRLQLSDNLITDIGPLALFEGKHIELADNEISDLTPAEGWENVTHVYLANNPLEDSNDSILFTMRRAGVLVDLERAYNIQVFIGKERLTFNVVPYQASGTTLVEFRPIFTKLGLKINYDAATKTITGSKNGLDIVLNIGNRFATVNGKFRTLNLAPQINKGVTMVPLRFVAEASGQEVSWNAFTRTIFIGSQAEQVLRTMEKSREYYTTFNVQAYKSVHDSTYLRFFELDDELYTFYDSLLKLNASFDKKVEALEITEMKPGQAVVQSVATVTVTAAEDTIGELPQPVTYNVVNTLRKNNSGMWLIVDEKKTVVTEPSNTTE